MRVADRDPAPAAGVDGAGGVQRDELEVDPVTGQDLAVPVLLALHDDPTQDVVEPRGRQVEVDEAGPETSIRSTCGGSSASSASTILAATSRGGRPTDFVRRMATLVVKSPWPACVGGVSSTPPSGSGNPAASSARRSAARIWSRITP